MKYYGVDARWWNDDLQAHFGDPKTIHEISDTEIVQYIIKFGRAKIDSCANSVKFGITVPDFTEAKAKIFIYLENDYD